ncbi:MarR family winged helix-turn-helix transcriptional regulator [Arhodomonas sp. AD133]|uniref:MarR family winged helix-turn-helix transcriptional regulator n=1 Tax=Arhodomonas sp. AD133 TaxID=3415009 RepID=UPI003EBC4B1D
MVSNEFVAENCACFHLRSAARVVTRAYDRALAPTGLRITQFTLLVAASMETGASLTTLAEHMAMDRTTLSRNLRPLEKRGLLTVSQEGYRRERTIHLTPEGTQLLERAKRCWEGAQQEIVERLGEERWQRLKSELGDLVAVG